MINYDITLQEIMSLSVADKTIMGMIFLPAGSTMLLRTGGPRMEGKCSSDCYSSDPTSLKS